jgi:hypothetical protein
MLELAAIIVVGAIALTFFSDMSSGAAKLARRRRSDKIRVATPEQSAH